MCIRDSPDTQRNYANEFDLIIKGWLLNEPNYRLGLMAGYQESRYSFTARGGSYIYSSEAVSYTHLDVYKRQLHGQLARVKTGTSTRRSTSRRVG